MLTDIQCAMLGDHDAAARLMCAAGKADTRSVPVAAGTQT